VQFDPAAFVADPELLEALEEHASALPCESDKVLFEQGDPAVGLYILHAGRATLSMAADGNTILTVETGPGALLGLPGLIGNQPYTMTGTAYAGADVRFIDRREFTALMHTHPKLSFKILQVLAAEVRTARAALS
jgi:CRP/FNR family cyclic AMP-dependent transcriptional regulator